MKKKITNRLQRYLGAIPRNMNCTNWSEMRGKCADEIISIVSDDAIRFLEWTRENDWNPAGKNMSHTEWLWSNEDDNRPMMDSSDLYAIFRKKTRNKKNQYK